MLLPHFYNSFLLSLAQALFLLMISLRCAFRFGLWKVRRGSKCFLSLRTFTELVEGQRFSRTELTSHVGPVWCLTKVGFCFVFLSNSKLSKDLGLHLDLSECYAHIT